MDNQRKRKKANRGTIAKRSKLNHLSADRVRELVDSEKGEAIQALHTIFDHTSILFDTRNHVGLLNTFITFLSLEGYSFIGYGNNKVSSRAAACKVALIYLLKYFHENDYLSYNPVVQRLNIDEDIANTLPDIVASLTLSKYEQLRRDSEMYIPWFKMLASIVVIENEDVDNAQVIALATGSKCIEPKNIRLDGSVIVDSHAETLIRRSFQFFLYSQMSSCSGSTIIEKHGLKFRVKPRIRFYLFINSAPCGDSRIFTISDKGSSQDKHPNRISRGVLRIKLDGGNSTVPLTNLERYDNKRLMVMSCSDKLLKINLLGLQGSLLSTFIEPVYLTGIIIGDSFRKSDLTRALYERADDIKLPTPFSVCRPIIYGLEKVPKVVSKSPKTSVNWIYGNSPEVTKSTTGRTMSGQLSRLCKRSLFKRFINLQVVSKNSYTYEDCKRDCVEYHVAKESFHKILESKHLGKWIKRVPSFDAFVVEKEEIDDINSKSQVEPRRLL